MEHFRSVVPEKLLSKSYASPTHVSCRFRAIVLFSNVGQENMEYLILFHFGHYSEFKLFIIANFLYCESLSKYLHDT